MTFRSSLGWLYLTRALRAAKAHCFHGCVPKEVWGPSSNYFCLSLIFSLSSPSLLFHPLFLSFSLSLLFSLLPSLIPFLLLSIYK